jgi:hypothetical protein
MRSSPRELSSFSKLSDEALLRLRAQLDSEMRSRKLAFKVGDFGESVAIAYFKATPGFPKLQLAPANTKNVDALSRDGDRYSIKTICNAKKTGTIYPDRDEPDKQLFEFLLVVKLTADWQLASIYQLNWATFVDVRSWDKRMNAWYVSCSASTLRKAKQIYPATNKAQSPT